MNKCLIQPYRIPICLQPKENLKPYVEVLAFGKGVLIVCALSLFFVCFFLNCFIIFGFTNSAWPFFRPLPL